MLELSMAIKCPSIDFHLLTLKKFQEVFANDSFLFRVMNDDNIEGAMKLKDLFLGIWSLQNLEDKEV